MTEANGRNVADEVCRQMDGLEGVRHLYWPDMKGIKDRDPVRDRETLPLTLRVSSPDFAGLLAAMTRFFAKHGLPISAHHTHKSPLPRSEGLFTYRHRFTVLLPPEFNRKSFLAELDQLETEVNFIRDDISHSDFY